MSASESLIQYINVKLALLGLQPVETTDGAKFNEIVSTLIAQYRESFPTFSLQHRPDRQVLQQPMGGDTRRQFLHTAVAGGFSCV